MRTARAAFKLVVTLGLLTPGLSACQRTYVPGVTPTQGGTGGLRGRLLGTDGRPASGVTVTLRSMTALAVTATASSTVPSGATTTPYRTLATVPMTAVTSGDGYFTFADVPAGAYGAEADLSGDVKAGRQGIVVAAGKVLDMGTVPLGPVGTVTGHVQLQTLPGITAGLALTEVDLPGLAGKVAVNASGNYALAGVPAGTFELHAGQAGFLDAWATVSVPADDLAMAPPLALGISGGGVTGKAVHNGPAGPAGITVGLQLAQVTVATTRTGADGSYAFAHIPQGTYAVTFADTGYVSPASVQVAVQEGGTTAVPGGPALNVVPPAPRNTIAGAGMTFATGLAAGIPFTVGGAAGTGFLVVWADGTGLKGTIADSTWYDRVIAFPIVGSTGATHPTVASDGANFLVGWQDGAGRAHAIEVTSAGSTPSAVVDLDPGQTVANPVVCANGNGSFVAAWTRTSGTHATWASGITGYTSAGTPAQVHASSTAQDGPAIAWNGVNHLVAWQEGGAIAGALVGSNGSPGSSATLSDGAAAAPQLPAVGASGGAFLVGWLDGRDGGRLDLFDRTVSGTLALGTPRLGAAFQYVPGAPPAPSLAAVGSAYQTAGLSTLVAGQVLLLPVAQALDSTGAPSGGAFNVAVGAATAPVVASDGTNYLHVWQAPDGSLLGQGVHP